MHGDQTPHFKPIKNISNFKVSEQKVVGSRSNSINLSSGGRTNLSDDGIDFLQLFAQMQYHIHSNPSYYVFFNGGLNGVGIVVCNLVYCCVMVKKLQKLFNMVIFHALVALVTHDHGFLFGMP